MTHVQSEGGDVSFTARPTVERQLRQYNAAHGESAFEGHKEVERELERNMDRERSRPVAACQRWECCCYLLIPELPGGVLESSRLTQCSVHGDSSVGRQESSISAPQRGRCIGTLPLARGGASATHTHSGPLSCRGDKCTHAHTIFHQRDNTGETCKKMVREVTHAKWAVQLNATGQKRTLEKPFWIQLFDAEMVQQCLILI